MLENDCKVKVVNFQLKINFFELSGLNQISFFIERIFGVFLNVLDYQALEQLIDLMHVATHEAHSW